MRGINTFWISNPINVFGQIFTSKTNNEFEKNSIYSPYLHQELYQKLPKCFSNYIAINIFPNILSEEDIVIVIEEKVNDRDFEKSDIEIETYESIKKLKYPQDYKDGGIIILDDLNEEEMVDPRIQARFKRYRHNLPIFIINQDYDELPKRNIRTNGQIYLIIKPNNCRDVQKSLKIKLPWI